MGKIQYYWREFRELESTNLYLERAIAEGELREAVVLAETQTDGRGRLGRRWISPPGGLYMSCSVCPNSSRYFSFYPVAAGLSILEFFRLGGIESLSLKWPNDILFISPDGTEYKLGGILSRTVSAPSGEIFLVVGIGINVNNRSNSIGSFMENFYLSPVSLIEISARRFSVRDLARGLSKRLYQIWGRIEESPQMVKDRFLKLWRRNNLTIGREVKVIFSDGTEIIGIAEDIDEDFNLLVREGSGVVRSVSSGDCLHLR